MAKKRKIKKRIIPPVHQIISICYSYRDLVVESVTKNNNYYVILKIKPTDTSITYHVKIVALKSYKPKIYIVDPVPKKLFAGLTNVPHVFSKKEGRICLFYKNEITLGSDYAIIIPWISEWLFNFEIWKITGKWCGGGHTIATRDLKDI